MTEPRDDVPDTPLGDVLGDVPLFRELQRVLLAGAGPVNWELARQVGIAVASWGKEDPLPTEHDRAEVERTVRAAELAVADFTGMEPPRDLAAVTCQRRANWVEANIGSLRDLVEPVAVKLAGTLSELQGEARGGDAAMLDALMGRMAPLLLGAQIGSVLGYLGQRVLGQYDVALPRDPGTVAFVLPNIAEVEREWSLDPVEFRGWVAVHETTHRFEFARPWVREHFGSMVRSLTEHTELDVGALEQRLGTLDLSDPERLGEALGNPAELVNRVMSEDARLMLTRLQAFLAVAEGYGDHVTHLVAAAMLRSHGRIEEAIRRRREGEAGETRLVEQLLGIDVKPEQYALGREFCETVAERTDERVLARMWESPDNLPSLPELEEPTLWLSRIA